MTPDLRRRRQVFALAGSLLDWVPGVATSTGATVARSAARGEVPSEWVSCGVCDGEGRRRVRGIDTACDRCGGSGRRAVDGYTGREIRVDAEVRDESPAEVVRRRVRERERRDSELALLGHLAGVRAGVEAADWWLSRAMRERDRLYGSGSYGALVRAHEVLFSRLPETGRLWFRVVVYAEPVRVSPKLGGVLEVTADRLALLMPDPIRVPVGVDPQAVKWAVWHGRTRAHERLRAERDRRIAEAARAGVAVAEIAAQEELSERRVRQVLQIALDTRTGLVA